ncbi:hypothetical protein [Halocynthiibacter namhaensis]|uniref:hypothetical protein n=1 Tax=Halocynthiibacter namhaensis TaxID=1290553 RepID=UPI0012E04597|nr:hypothetical protein [Halocynthiibacter namhaensis]
MFIFGFGLIGAFLGTRRATRLNGARIDKIWLAGIFGVVGMILGLLTTVFIERMGLM